MLNIIRDENERLKNEIAGIRRTIMNIEPTVMVDGRFEAMMTSPHATLTIARKLLEASQNAPKQ